MFDKMYVRHLITFDKMFDNMSFENFAFGNLSFDIET
jgi:hypothetical protein